MALVITFVAQMEQVVNVQSAPKEPTARGTLPSPALSATRGGLPSILGVINGGSVGKVRNSIMSKCSISVKFHM